MTEGCAARQSRVVCLSVRPALAWTKDITCWTVVFWPRCGESPPLGPTAAASPGLSEQSGVSSHGAGSRPPRQRCPADPRPRPAVNPSKPPSGEGPPWHQPAAGPRAQDTLTCATAGPPLGVTSQQAPPVLSRLLGQWQPGRAGGTQRLRLRVCELAIEEAKTSLSLSLAAKAGCRQPAGFIGSPGPPPLLLWRPGLPPRKTR